MTDRIGIGIVVKIRNAFHQAHRVDGRDEIFADAAFQQFAIQQNIVIAADDNDLGAGIAALREPVEFRQQRRTAQRGIDDDQVRRRAIDVVRDGSRNTAHVNAHVRLRQATIFGRILQNLGAALVIAERLDRNPRNRPRTFGGFGVEASVAVHKLIFKLCRLRLV